MKGKRIWVVVADGARARFFLANQGGRILGPALDQVLVADRRPSRELVTDKPGRTKDRAAYGRHAMEPPTDPHEQEQIALAREVAHLLDDERAKGHFDEVVIVAAPRMLGHIRTAMSDALRKMIRREIAKDFSKLEERELKERLEPLI
ncbi:host attachment protein [Thermopetrobacter sp. TC1]|uniref:host attachment protein n=1 Tax=Thermopetrobacter sp. TC1 TaxID=1495045 RepID=UPI00056DB9BD|nr:host attachment protein [Thermopetrobacter sp. TC1]